MKKYIFALIATMFLPLSMMAQNVAKIGTDEYATLAAAFGAVQDGETIELLRDYDARSEFSSTSARLAITKSITIEGNNYTLTVGGRGLAPGMNATSNVSVTMQNITIQNPGTGARCVDTRGKLNTLNLTNVTLKTDGGLSYTQPLTIGGNQSTAATINITNSTIQTNADATAYYAIITFNPVKMTIDNSTIKGWACIYAKGQDGSAGSAGSVFSIKNGSKLISKNEYSGDSNSFGAIVFEDDDVTVNISESTINVEATGDQKQSIALYSSGADDTDEVNINASAITLTGENATYAIRGQGTSATQTHVTLGEGTTSNEDIPDDNIDTSKSVVIYNGVDTYTVGTVDDAVAKIGDKLYATLQAAVAAVPTDGTATTIVLLKDITLTDNVVVGGTYGATPKVTTAITNQNVTLNLNNHNITGEKTIYLAGGSLNITGSGVIESTSEDVAPVGVRYVKTSTYPNLDYTSKRTLTIGNYVTVRGAQYGLNVFGTNEGTTANDIEVNVNGQVQGMLFVLGNLKNEANNIVINVNGTVDASGATGSEKVKTGIALSGNATVNVSHGAMVKGESGIEARAGELNVNGGTITGVASAYSYAANGSGTTTKGAAIAVAQHNTNLQTTVNVNGGTLNAEKLIAVTDVNNDMTKVSVTAKQNFVVNTETVVPEKYGWISNGDGTYTLKKAVAMVDDQAYETFVDAVAAAGNEKVITLLDNVNDPADATDFYTLSEGQLLQVIQNGYNITVKGPNGTTDEVFSEVVTVGGKDVTIYMLRTDISSLVDATLRSNWTGEEQSVPLEITYGNLTLVKGTDYKLQVAGTDVDDVKKTDVGPVTFKVVGLGKFYGEKEVTWTIYKDINNAPIRVEVDPAIYTTADIDPKDYVHVYDGDTELENPADYTVEASTTIKDAKTYVNAVTVKGTETAEKYIGGEVTFSMDVQPLDIRDVTAAGNAQPWRAAGYTTAQIAELITLTTTGGVALEKDVDYTITVADGTYKDVNTYEDVITITAKSSNYSGTLKLDFTILPEGVIDISKCVVTSKAVYTSISQKPSYNTIEVVYKDGTTRVVLDEAQFKIQINGMQSGYIDAKTYSNAMTLVGTTAVGTSNTLRFYGSVSADYVITPRDLADIDYDDDEVEVVLEKHKDMVWDGTDLSDDIMIGDIAGTNNLYLYMKVKDNGYRYPLTNDEANSKYDYSYSVEPSPMVEPGEYKVIFTGRGNFTGMREVKINVLKDITLIAAGIELPLQVIPDNTSLAPSMLKDIVVKDGSKALESGIQYEIVVTDESGSTTYDETNPITDDGMYKVSFKGLEPYYFNTTANEMPVLFEYNHFDANVDDQYYNGNASGYLIEQPVSIHVTSGKNLECQVGDNNMPAVAADSYTITLPGEAKFTLGSNTYTLKVVGIEDNAFTGAESAHYVDATALTDYVPATLTRDYDGPFNGLPKQTLVFLRGTDFTGENYIYKYGDGDTDFRCDVLKIYEDLSGEQTGYNQANGYKWGFLNPYEFKANTVTNTRQLNAVNAENKQQGYTICLPYALPVPNAVDAYTLMASKSDLLGFKPVDGNTLDALTPYVLIPSASGQLLSTTNATIVKTTDADLNATAVTSASADGNAYTMYGSMTYMDALIGAYIMQSGNVWKQIDHEGSYGNGACILPMRAYIVPGTQPAPVLYSIFGMPGSTEMDIFEHIDIDAEDGQLYDLQGRPVTTPTRGIYVRNGKKVVIK